MLPLPKNEVCIALVNLFSFLIVFVDTRICFILTKNETKKRNLKSKRQSNCRQGLFNKCPYSTKIATPFYFKNRL